MHICFVMHQIEFYSPTTGGALATIACELATPLLALAHGVTVLSPDNGTRVYDVGEVIKMPAAVRERLSATERIACKLEGKIHRWDMPYFRAYRLGMISAMKKMGQPPDVVILFNDLASAQFVKQAVPGARVFVDLQNENRTRQRDFAAADKCVDKYIACSQYIKNWTVREHGVPPERVAVLLSGVDVRAFAPRPDFLEPRRGLKALFVGRIDPNKGPDIAADAVAALRSEGIQINLTVAGGTWFYGHNPQDPYLVELIKKTELAGGKYIGPVARKDVAELFRQHDIAFVLSRSQEPFGLVVLEAMASGLAVIASNRGGIPEACGDAGRLVNPDDFRSVVANLRELATNPAALAEEKRKSLARAAECTWKKRAEELLEILGGAAARGT